MSQDPSKNTALQLVETTTDLELAEKFKQARQQKTTSFESFIKDFLGNFLSPQTKKAYIKDLSLFFEFLQKGGEQITHPQQIQAYHFQYYRDWLMERGLSSATINRRLVCIRSFMKWALASHLIDHNPLDAVKLPKVRTESPTLAFSDDEVRQMLCAPNTHERTGNLHRMIMVFLFHLGLRRSEIARMQKKDFFQDRGHFVLKILSKGHKERLLPIPPQVLQEMQEYESRLPFALDPEDYFLQARKSSKQPKPMDGSTIFRVIERYAKACGITKKVSPHSCRATAISHLLDTKKIPIRDVAIFAGHSNITTTERYDKRRKGLDDNAVYKIDYETLEKKVS